MRRRNLLALIPILPLLAACGSPQGATPSAPTSAKPFSWTVPGYDNKTITLDKPATRIVADVYSAAALQPYGITTVGVFGYGQKGAGKGALEMEKLNRIGIDGELSLEKLAAAKPDLIIGYGNKAGTGWTWWDEKVTTQAAAIAPFVAMDPLLARKGPDNAIEAYRSLAQALGGQIDSPELTKQKAAYEAARERVRAAAAKTKVTVLPINASDNVVYTSHHLGMIAMLKQDGVNIVGPPSSLEKVWATTSWEKIGDHKADVVLLYPQSVGHEQNPLYLNLPAVKAGQVGTWDDKRAYTHASYTEWLNETADLLEKAKVITE